MKDRMLFYISLVADDSTGIHTPGELDYGIRGDSPLPEYLAKHGEAGKQTIRDMVEAVLKSAERLPYSYE